MRSRCRTRRRPRRSRRHATHALMPSYKSGAFTYAPFVAPASLTQTRTEPPSAKSPARSPKGEGAPAASADAAAPSAADKKPSSEKGALGSFCRAALYDGPACLRELLSAGSSYAARARKHPCDLPRSRATSRTLTQSRVISRDLRARQGRAARSRQLDGASQGRRQRRAHPAGARHEPRTVLADDDAALGVLRGTSSCSGWIPGPRIGI